jgi:hypothetical protein
MPMSFPNPQLIGYSTSNNNRVQIGLGSTTLLVENSDRLYAEVRNTSQQAIWFSKGIPAVVGQGTRLQTGAIRTFTDNELYLGQLNAITLTSPVTIEVEEGV